MKYEKLRIYYFSGTGNSQNVALWISKVAKTENVDCQIVNIAKINRLSIEMPNDNELIIFLSPVHGFNYPPIMFYFILRFPKGKNNVFLMNTRAGMRIGTFITPGLSGTTFYFAALILKIKGYSITGMYPVDLPSNWISVHPGLNKKAIQFINSKIKKQITALAHNIIDGKSNFRGVREIVQDIAIMPITFLYFFIGRFALAKSYFASADCNNCGLCIKNCPVEAIKMVGNHPFWTFNCESCMKCMSNCPKKAIETAHGFVVALLVLWYTFLLGLLYEYVGVLFEPIKNSSLQFVIEGVLSLALLAVGYRVIHFLLRFRIFERILVFTSLTKYKFWGKRYKAPKEKL